MLESAVMPWARAAGSARWAPWLIGLLALGAAAGNGDPSSPAWPVALPAALLALNLAVAIAVNRRFHGRTGLLVFHVALLACMLLIGAGRLLSLEARVELPVGSALDVSNLEVRRRGPLHTFESLVSLEVVQGPFEIEYPSGRERGASRVRVHVAGPDGSRGDREGGDTAPVVAGDYRLHTTSNKGYAVRLTWMPENGDAVTGYVHLPSFPLYDWAQIARWRPPGGHEVELEIAPPLTVPEGSAWRFDSASAAGVTELVLRPAGLEPQVLRLGGTALMPGGRLRFDGVSAWMGYRVSTDPTLPWLLAAALVGAAGLVWHLFPGTPGSVRAARPVAVTAPRSSHA